MEYQKLIDLLDNTSNQPSKIWTKNWVEINYTNNQIKFKTSILKPTLCDYSGACILVTGTISVAAAAGGAVNNDKEVIFKNCAPFTDCMSETNNIQIDTAKDIDVVMPMYKLIRYNDNYSKTSGNLDNAIEINHF